MTLPNIFTTEVSNNVIARIQTLNPESQALWGRMNVAQMLAHCNVTYEMIFTDKHKAPTGFMKLIMILIVKNAVTNVKPYKPNLKTAPAFIIADKKEFEVEKSRLIQHIKQTQELGQSYFDGKQSLSFGVLSAEQWNNMLYKHLNHHLAQFGV